jgi:hypothetical protein
VQEQVDLKQVSPLVALYVAQLRIRKRRRWRDYNYSTVLLITIMSDSTLLSADLALLYVSTGFYIHASLFLSTHFYRPGPTRLTPVMIRDGPVECNPRPLLCTPATALSLPQSVGIREGPRYLPGRISRAGTLEPVKCKKSLLVRCKSVYPLTSILNQSSQSSPVLSSI